MKSHLYIASSLALFLVAGAGCDTSPPEDVEIDESSSAQVQEPVAAQMDPEPTGPEAVGDPEELDHPTQRSSNREDLATLTTELLEYPEDGDGDCRPLLESEEFDEFARFAFARGAKLLIANWWGSLSEKTDNDHIDSQSIDENSLEYQVVNDDSLCLPKMEIERLLASVIFEEVLQRREILRRPESEDVALFVSATKEIVVALYDRALDHSDGVVDGENIKAAFEEMQNEIAWNDELQSPEHPPFSLYRFDYLRLTEDFISSDDFDADEVEPIPDWSGLSADEEATRELRNQLTAFTRQFVDGSIPMRPDNYVVSPDREVSATRRYLDAALVRNGIAAQFPHRIDAAGALEVRTEPNPGVMSRRDRRGQTFTVAARNLLTAIDHDLPRTVLIDSLADYKTVLDPLAWEYSRVRLGRYFAYLLERSAHNARERGAAMIERRDVLNTIDEEESLVYGDPPTMPGTGTTGGGTKFFADVSEEAGFPTELTNLDGTYVNARFDQQRFMGAGIAVGDVTGNGYPDLYLSGEGLNRLFINGGEEAPGIFDDATVEWGLPEDLFDVRAALFVDFDGDGTDELLLVRSDEPSQIFRLQDDRFVDITEELGLRTRTGAHTAGVADFDGDGRLDLYIGYYGSEAFHRGRDRMSTPASDGRNGRPNQFWRMTDEGRFEEISRDAGIADTGWTLVTAAFDYDRDGHTDLYVVNDYGPNVMYKNMGDGTFKDITIQARLGDGGSGMNASITDLNADGFWDVYVTNIDMPIVADWFVFPNDEGAVDDPHQLLDAHVDGPGNRLFENAEDGENRHSKSVENLRFGNHSKGWCWGAVFFDYDLDGHRDMYVANGWIAATSTHNQNNQFYRRRGDRFELQPSTGSESFAGNSRSVVAVDIDRDGMLDLVVNNYRQPPVLLKNTHRTNHRSLQLRLTGPPQQPSAIGAIVEVNADGHRQFDQVIVGANYLGQQDRVLTFGVGGARTANITVRWPDGTEQSWDDVATGDLVDLVYEGE